ncbi:cAMP-dependent protein kinase type II regulatory subunit isoform X1 [Hydra vulgaris]|uniref:cAMP-dependent protein kinase type II regulatory subunit isoform X1 n=3 Tax=Hydra vulgaris TaxID=6087 RepID=A0ABM4C4A4_HYDVU|nr:cAMP-dependent protein kinase type II regulatory subunit isoform X1 [Hydra vulgaris]XP_047137962.1 cAMP-dependent protein kinase type II regulatory subunit isoform X1 [Hydra vulgaris]
MGNKSAKFKRTKTFSFVKEPNGEKFEDSSFKMFKESFQNPILRGRRTAVAAESYDPSKDTEEEEAIVYYPKTEKQMKCLNDAASGIVFFKSCDAEQLKVLFGAMFEKKVNKGDVIIKQGDDGDNFYVIEKGIFDVHVKKDSAEKIVATLEDKGFFGDLALLYNCPRNATIIAKSEGVLWGLDQKTFKRIVVKATAKKRLLFEELLKTVSMLQSLTSYELMNLTDALDVETFNSEVKIISEGEEASKMYFIMEGQVAVRVNSDGIKKEIIRLEKGKYFGELALILQKPRVASVYATMDNTKCAVLNIHAFERLLGPCVNIMKRNLKQYEEERKRLGIEGITYEEK